jgi:hypothetical protein
VSAHRPAVETNDPLIADHRNFYKVEKWTKDGAKVDHMLYAGSSNQRRLDHSIAHTGAPGEVDV